MSDDRPWMSPHEVEARRRAAEEFCAQPAGVTLDWDALLARHHREVAGAPPPVREDH